MANGNNVVSKESEKITSKMDEDQKLEDQPEVQRKLETKDPLSDEQKYDDEASQQRQSFLLNKGPKIE